MLAAEMPDLIDGLLLLSYPLHPPGKPQQFRTAHFPKLNMPALFVHGSRDPFGSFEELKSALALIPRRRNCSKSKARATIWAAIMGRWRLESSRLS